MNSEYTIKIDFKKGSENPERVFKSMAGLIEAFRNFDMHLAKSVCADIEPILLLQEVESGSIKTKLATALKAIDDSALKDLDWKKLVGSFLLKGKYRLLEHLEGKKTINDIKQLEEITNDLVQLAKETKVLHIPSYSPIPPWTLLVDIQRLSDAISPLITEDRALLITDNRPQIINPNFHLTAEAIEKILTEKTFSHDQEMILKVKKPDFLGQSMWEFKLGHKSLLVKILDRKWLESFHKQKVTVKPGDSLHGLVRHQENVDQRGQLISETYQILEVWNIIEKWDVEQLDMFP